MSKNGINLLLVISSRGWSLLKGNLMIFNSRSKLLVMILISWIKKLKSSLNFMMSYPEKKNIGNTGQDPSSSKEGTGIQKCFHMTTLKHREYNRIKWIYSNNQWVDKYEDMIQEVIHFFSSLLDEER